MKERGISERTVNGARRQDARGTGLEDGRKEGGKL